MIDLLYLYLKNSKALQPNSRFQVSRTFQGSSLVVPFRFFGQPREIETQPSLLLESICMYLHITHAYLL